MSNATRSGGKRDHDSPKTGEHGVPGKGGYDRNIVGREALLKTVEYIHGNPVRRELVLSPVEWEWSSAAQWEGKADGPIPVEVDSFPSI